MTSSGKQTGDDFVRVVDENDVTAIHDVIRAQVTRRHDAMLGQVPTTQVERLALLGHHHKCFVIGEAQPTEGIQQVLRLWRVHRQAFYDTDTTFLFCLVSQGTLSGQLADLFVELDIIAARTRSKHRSSSDEEWILNRSSTCTSSAFLLLDFASRTRDFSALLGFVRSLALGGQITFHVQVDCVIVGLDAENIIADLLAGGLLAFGIVYSDFHDLGFGLANDNGGAFVSRNSTFHDEESLFGHDLEYLEILYSHLRIAHTTRHAHAFVDARWG